MYGAIQMLVRYERFGGILHEDCMFMDAVRGFHAPIRQRASIFVRKNTKKYLQKPLIRSLNGIYWRYSEFSDRHYTYKPDLDRNYGTLLWMLLRGCRIGGMTKKLAENTRTGRAEMVTFHAAFA